MNFNHVPVKYRSLALVLTLSMPTSLGFAQTVSNENSTPPAMMQEGNMPVPPDGHLPPGPPPDGKIGPQQQTKDASEFTAAKVVDGTAANIQNTSLTATQTDENAFLVRNGGQVTLADSTLATDRGEGNVIVNGAKIKTSGEGSPCVYSTGNIQLTNGKGEATGSEIAVVEGKNSITLNKVNLTGHVDHGIMLYQSFSGDAGVGEAKFSAKDSMLTNASSGPMFYVTNTTATASLDNTDLVQSGDVLSNVTSGRWGTSGKNGGDFTLNAAKEKLKGKILANNISKVTLNLGSKANWTGSWQKINPISTLK